MVLGLGTKVDVRLPGKGNSNFLGVRPVHHIISMIKWIPTSRLSIKSSLSAREDARRAAGADLNQADEGTWSQGLWVYRGTSLIRNSALLGPYSRDYA